MLNDKKNLTLNVQGSLMLLELGGCEGGFNPKGKGLLDLDVS